jgi:hypothetical protein
MSELQNPQIFGSLDDDGDGIDESEELFSLQNPHLLEKDKFQQHESSSIKNVLHLRNEVFHEEGIIHLFLDSEFEDNTYICLQCHILFFLKGKLEMKSFIIFNEIYESFCKKKFGYFQQVKGQEVEIFYERGILEQLLVLKILEKW